MKGTATLICTDNSKGFVSHDEDRNELLQSIKSDGKMKVIKGVYWIDGSFEINVQAGYIDNNNFKISFKPNIK